MKSEPEILADFVVFYPALIAAIKNMRLVALAEVLGASQLARTEIG